MVTKIEVEGEQIRLNERQMNAMRRLKKTIGAEYPVETFAGDLSRQLEAKGLIMWGGHYYDRTEWNRVIARLRIVSLTEKGKQAIAILFPESQEVVS